MKELTRVSKLSDRRETQLRGKLMTIDDIRGDGLNDLDLLAQDFQHMSLVVKSVQRNYRRLLKQNRRLQVLLLKSMDRCYCWPGNRCDRCQEILEVLGNPSLCDYVELSED
jgi:hypothetical protein